MLDEADELVEPVAAVFEPRRDLHMHTVNTSDAISSVRHKAPDPIRIN